MGIMVMVSSTSLLQVAYVEISMIARNTNINENGYLNTSYCKAQRKLITKHVEIS